MQTLAKTFNIIAIIIGLLAIIGGLDTGYGTDGFAILGGVLFMSIGAINLANNSDIE